MGAQMNSENLTEETMSAQLRSLSFDELKREVHIVMIPNEDGLGPSTALFYVARGLAKVADEFNISLKFVVWNKSKAGFNIGNYKELSTRVAPEFHDEHSVVHLKKDGEKVVPMATAEAMLDYLWRAGEYAAMLERHIGTDPDLHCVICMGTPVGHVSARFEKLQVPIVEVFDHSWCLSLQQIFEAGRKEYPDEWRTRTVDAVDVARERFRERRWPNVWSGQTVNEIITRQILPVVEDHDAKVDHVFLLPEPLAPGEFWCKWQSLAPGRVVRIGGVMGGWAEAARESVRRTSRKDLVAPDKLNWPVQDIDAARIILVQGGGTPIWDRFLVHMLGQCLDWEGKLTDTLFLFTKGSVKAAFDSPFSDKASAKRRWCDFAALEQAVRQSTTARLVSGDKAADFADFQRFYLVSDLVFSRPGGITVQDAVACRTPLVCAAEPGHWQTEKIRQHCLLHGIMRDVAFEAFQAGGIGLVLDQFGLTEQNNRMVEIMSTIANRQEYPLARDILAIIASNVRK